MKRQGIQAKSGFTLVEIVIVFAITGLLMAGLLITEATQRNYPQFTADIDQLQVAAKNIQSQSTATLYNGRTGTSDYVVFGKAMIFNASSPTTYTIATLLQPEAAGVPATNLVECDVSTVSLPDGVVFSGTQFTGPNVAANKSGAFVFRHIPDQIYVAVSSSAFPTTNDPTACTGTPVVGRSALPSLNLQLAALLAIPLRWLAPPALAAAAGNNTCDILNLTDYASGGCSNLPGTPLQIQFTDPTDPNHFGYLDADGGNNNIYQEYNY